MAPASRAELLAVTRPTKQDQAEAVRALSKLKNVRREDMVTLRPQSEVAVGLNRAEWKRKVDSTRSSAVSAVSVRHILVQSEEMQRGLHDMLKGGADFTELARASSDCASTREKGGVVVFRGSRRRRRVQKKRQQIITTHARRQVGDKRAAAFAKVVQKERKERVKAVWDDYYEEVRQKALAAREEGGTPPSPFVLSKKLI